MAEALKVTNCNLQSFGHSQQLWKYYQRSRDFFFSLSPAFCFFSVLEHQLREVSMKVKVIISIFSWSSWSMRFWGSFFWGSKRRSTWWRGVLREEKAIVIILKQRWSIWRSWCWEKSKRPSSSRMINLAKLVLREVELRLSWFCSSTFLLATHLLKDFPCWSPATFWKHCI